VRRSQQLTHKSHPGVVSTKLLHAEHLPVPFDGGQITPCNRAGDRRSDAKALDIVECGARQRHKDLER
jgi:hypothetical protein